MLASRAPPMHALLQLLLASLSAAAAPAAQEAVDPRWRDARELTVEGQGWSELAAPWDRLPARAEALVREPVWRLSRDSAGVAVRFTSDAERISARWSLTSAQLAMPHMAATGVSGLDLYVRDAEHGWRWLGTGQPRAQEGNVAVLASGIPPAAREYLLYLPLYNGVRSLELGVPAGRTLEPAAPRPEGRRRPIVFYGTSITQGACASRPGMAHPAILGRRLGRPVVNLGFSGNGRLELELAELLGELDAAAFVVDCLPNLRAEQVRERTVPFVRALRELRPQTPILLVEDRSYAGAFLRAEQRERNDSSRAALREGYQALLLEGVTGLAYLEGDALLGEDGEGTVDSSHPNDLGFARMADAFQPALEALVGPAPPPEPRRPNVLFLMSDDQRADALSAAGHPDVRTPALDRLALRGTWFERAYCMGSNSGAVCQPSRAMVLTGRSLYRIPGAPADPGTPVALLPELFRAAGYATFGTGKWHNGRDWFARGFEDGAAIFFGGMGSHTELAVHDYDPSGEFPGDARRPIGAFSSEAFADAAVRFLAGHDGSRPFFLYVSFTAPHDPRTPPPEYRARYDPERLALPPNFLPLHPFDNGEMVVRDERLAPWPRTAEVVREHLADYYAMIEHLDAQVGRVLAALESSGFAEDTVVVYASDHGLAVGSHGLLGKQNLYEHSMRAPLILAGPGIPEGRRDDRFAYLFELHPTLCELAGIELPEGSGVEGRSLLGAGGGRRGSVFTAYKGVQRAVRDGRWKLIRYPRIDRTQLFDLAADPHETRDLAGDPAHVVDRWRLTGLLVEWQASVGDAQPLAVGDPLPAEFVPPR